jgi:Zn-dependent peptidase ImmA (M78 family)
MQSLPVRYHRKRLSLATKVLDRIHAEITIRSLHLERLLRSTELRTDFDVPRIDADTMDEDVESVAAEVRAHWRLPPGRIPNLVEVVESAGIIVVPCDFRAGDVDAVGFRPRPDASPLMFVNAALPTDRLRFTLAHELGHLVMHHVPTADMEAQADRFAAEFLMPAKQIRHQLQAVSLPILASLKPVWRVSMGALLMRAKHLRTVTAGRYHALWREMASHGFRRREPAESDLSPEAPTILRDLIGYHRKALGYTPQQLALGVCRLYIEDFERWYGQYASPGHSLGLVG